MTWHADAGLLARYATGDLPDAAAWSVEMHVTTCAPCRAVLEAPTDRRVATAIDEGRLDAVWATVDERVLARTRPLGERLLVRAGVADHDARLLAATPSLTASWLLGVAIVLAAGVAAAWLTPTGGTGPVLGFLLIAPLVPLAGVAVAFGRRVDPTHDLGVVAPMSSVRLLLLRGAAVVGTSVVLAAAAALALPTWGWVNVAWLLPSLALTAVTLAVTTRRADPTIVAAVVAVGWVVAVLALEARTTGTLTAFGPTGQSAMALVLAASVVATVTGHRRLDPAGRP